MVGKHGRREELLGRLPLRCVQKRAEIVCGYFCAMSNQHRCEPGYIRRTIKLVHNQQLCGVNFQVLPGQKL
ncbi:hypothetical protein BHE90_017656, partial [Fusarium euwallaceae]